MYCNTVLQGDEHFVDGAALPLVVDPLITRAVGNGPAGPQIATQPSYGVVYEELASFAAAGGRPDNLIDRLFLSGASDTRAIAKGVCSASLGSAATLVQ